MKEMAEGAAANSGSLYVAASISTTTRLKWHTYLTLNKMDWIDSQLFFFTDANITGYIQMSRWTFD